MVDINLNEYIIWCVGCSEDLNPSELVSEYDEPNHCTELYCPHCGDNHFGFYKKG